MFTARKSLLVVFFLIAAICASSLCAQDPGVADTVRIGDASGNVYSVLSVPVSLYNDEALTSIIIPVFVNGYSGWMTFDSITYAGGRLDGGLILPEREAYVYYTDTFTVEAVIVRFSVSSGDPLPAGDGVLCDLWFSPKFGGEVILDTMGYSPYGTLQLTDEAFTEFLPNFTPGAIDIACDYAIGDVDDGGACSFWDARVLWQVYYGCVYSYGFDTYKDDVNGDRRVDYRDKYSIIDYTTGGPAPICGIYSPADYTDPGIPDTLYIENAILYEGVPGTIQISLTNDEYLRGLALAFSWEGDVTMRIQLSRPENAPERTSTIPISTYACSTYLNDSGVVNFANFGDFTYGTILSPDTGAIIRLETTPQNSGTSTVRLAPNPGPGAESMFVSETNSAIIPVVVGGNITVLPIPCGDANLDGYINIGDAVKIINWIYKGGAAPDPTCLADTNGDESSDVGDAVYIVNYAFKGGPPPSGDCCVD